MSEKDRLCYEFKYGLDLDNKNLVYLVESVALIDKLSQEPDKGGKNIKLVEIIGKVNAMLTELNSTEKLEEPAFKGTKFFESNLKKGDDVDLSQKQQNYIEEFNNGI